MTIVEPFVPVRVSYASLKGKTRSYGHFFPRREVSYLLPHRTRTIGNVPRSLPESRSSTATTLMPLSSTRTSTWPTRSCWPPLEFFPRGSTGFLPIGSCDLFHAPSTPHPLRPQKETACFEVTPSGRVTILIYFFFPVPSIKNKFNCIIIFRILTVYMSKKTFLCHLFNKDLFSVNTHKLLTAFFDF